MAKRIRNIDKNGAILLNRHMKNKTSKTQGYTLLETVVYIGIFIVVLVATLDMLITLSRSFMRVRAYNEVRVSGTNAMERISREIRTANSLDLPGSSLDTHPGDLLLHTTDTGGAAKTVEFYFDSAAKNMGFIDNGIDKGVLTGSSTEVTNLVFRNASTTKGEVVKIEMTIRSKKLTDIAVKFYDTIVMRGGY